MLDVQDFELAIVKYPAKPAGLGLFTQWFSTPVKENARHLNLLRNDICHCVKFEPKISLQSTTQKFQQRLK